MLSLFLAACLIDGAAEVGFGDFVGPPFSQIVIRLATLDPLLSRVTLDMVLFPSPRARMFSGSYTVDRPPGYASVVGAGRRRGRVDERARDEEGTGGSSLRGSSERRGGSVEERIGE